MKFYLFFKVVSIWEPQKGVHSELELSDGRGFKFRPCGGNVSISQLLNFEPDRTSIV